MWSLQPVGRLKQKDCKSRLSWANNEFKASLGNLNEALSQNRKVKQKGRTRAQG